MSTRCQIHVDGHSTIIYKHSGGYPNDNMGKGSGILSNLLPVVKRFIKLRGFDDPDYLSARILHGLMKNNDRDYDRILRRCKREGQKPKDYQFYEDSRDTLGFGIEKYDETLHGDLEYYYVVKKDHVEVLQARKGIGFGGDDRCNIANWEVIRRVDFDGNPYGEKPVKTPVKRRRKELVA